MDHEHLHPDELDLLLDDESGPDTARLFARMEQCDACRNALGAARASVALLERLPHHVPPHDFSARVMSRVRVFEPLHVTVSDALERVIPASRGGRAFAAGLGALSGLIMTTIVLWGATRLDSLVVFTSFLMQRLRVEVAAAAQSFAISILGEDVASQLGVEGARSVWFSLGAGVTALLIAALGLQLLASAARRRRG